MIEQRIIVMEEELKDVYKPKTISIISISNESTDESRLQEIMDELGKRAHKQLEVLMTFIAIVGLPLTEDKYVRKADLIKKSGGSQSALKSLLDKKILISVNKPVSRFENEAKNDSNNKLELSSHQSEAYNSILQSFNIHNVVLLHG